MGYFSKKRGREEINLTGLGNSQTSGLRVIFDFYLGAGFIQPVAKVIDGKGVYLTGWKAKPSRQ